MSLEECNTKTQRHEGTKSEDEISHQISCVYKGVIIRAPLFIDVFIEDKVLVGIKATEKNHPIYETQVLTYLRLAGIKLGLLVNFGVPYVKDGVSRIINGVL